MLSGFVIDLAYVGANGISREYGLTTPDPAVSALKAEVMRVARRRVFSGVHTKFGVASFCRFAEVTEFEAIVTDTGLPASDAHRYSLLGPEVIRA
jgi:DeoR/GlpR family transcriptional regulator of sugar metabolism